MIRSLVASVCLVAASAAALGAQEAVVVRAAQLIDGAGGVRRNVDVLIQGGRIVGVTGRGSVPAGARLVDIGDRTLLPGLIDAHAHPSWYFNRAGRLHTANDGDTPAQSLAALAANAWATLQAGFTTIQSPGANADADVRDAILNRGLAGPRILTSLEPLSDRSGGPDSLRALIRQRKAQGADFIKLFASASIRDGGAQTMTDAQLVAACGEARTQGLRTIVHAHSAAAVLAATRAGCTEIEHGVFVTREVLDTMAARGTYFDPQCSLVFRNYLDNRAHYEGIGNYNEAGFAAMERAIPLAAAAIRLALTVPNLRILYGTDAVAGAHGHNAEDLVCRVESAGETAMHALLSATSVNAEALGLGDRVGRVAPGLEADLIATDGDPLRNIEAIRSVSFVMIGGRIVRNDGNGAGHGR